MSPKYPETFEDLHEIRGLRTHEKHVNGAPELNGLRIARGREAKTRKRLVDTTEKLCVLASRYYLGRYCEDLVDELTDRSYMDQLHGDWFVRRGRNVAECVAEAAECDDDETIDVADEIIWPELKTFATCLSEHGDALKKLARAEKAALPYPSNS